MFLTVRPGTPEDLPGAFVFIKKLFNIPAADCGDVRKMWAQALQEAECSSNVVEDTDRDEGDRITAFGLTFCAPQAVMDYAHHEAPPFLWRWTLERWRGGHKVWLDRKEARRAQLEGHVSVLAFLAADAYRYNAVDLGRMGNLFSAATVRELAGYRLQHFLTEASGTAQRDRFAGHGMAVLSDYNHYRDDPDLRALPPERRPFLMGADLKTLAQDVKFQNTSLGRAALVGPPRYGFSETEQELMKIALRGLTDQAIADRLGLSLIAIKKRWEGIYAKVNEKAYLHALEKAGDDDVAKIGRRQVLQMMTEHPEEFRPSPPRKRTAN